MVRGLSGRDMMEQIYHLGATAAAGILSVAPVDHPTIWSWFLLAAAASVCMKLREQSRRQTKSVPVLSKARRPMRRAASHAPWR
jgi:hypothetical protein